MTQQQRDGYDRDRFPDLSNGMYQATFPIDPEWPRGYLWDLLNMVYVGPGQDPEKMRGYSQVGTTLDGSISGLFEYKEDAQLIITTTNGTMWRWNGVTMNPLSGSVLNTNPNTRFDAANFYGDTSSDSLLVLANGVDAPQKTTGSSYSALSADAPSTGKYPTPWQGRLWMADGDVLYGSAVNDCEAWTTGDGGVNIQIDRGSGAITGLGTLLQDLIIFKNDAIFRLPFGVTIENTAVKEITRSFGCVASDSVRECAGQGVTLMPFLSDNGIKYIYGTDRQGDFAVDSLDEPINNIVQERSTFNQNATFALWNSARLEYYLHFPRSDSVIVPNEGVICNLARGGRRSPRWTRHNMAGITASGMARIQRVLTQFIGRDDGKVCKLHDTNARDGAAFTGRFFTAAHGQGDAGIMKHYGRIFFDYRAQSNSTIDARYMLGRENQPTPRSNTDTLTGRGGTDGWGVGTWGVAVWGGSKSGLGEYVRLDQARRGRWIRVLLETDTDNSWFKVSNYNIEFVPAAVQIRG